MNSIRTPQNLPPHPSASILITIFKENTQMIYTLIAIAAILAAGTALIIRRLARLEAAVSDLSAAVYSAERTILGVAADMSGGSWQLDNEVQEILSYGVK
jgi:hypothetical protein